MTEAHRLVAAQKTLIDLQDAAARFEAEAATLRRDHGIQSDGRINDIDADSDEFVIAYRANLADLKNRHREAADAAEKARRISRHWDDPIVEETSAKLQVPMSRSDHMLMLRLTPNLALTGRG